MLCECVSVCMNAFVRRMCVDVHSQVQSAKCKYAMVKTLQLHSRKLITCQ